jgi:hypothetical protein
MYGRSAEDIKKKFMKMTFNYSKFHFGRAIPPKQNITLGYMDDFDPGIPDKMPKIYVIDKDKLEILELFNDQKVKPVLINPISREFNGTIKDMEDLKGVKDYDIMLKTTFSRNVNIGSSQFPISHHEKCVLTLISTTIMKQNHTYYNTIKGRPIYSILTYVLPDEMEKITTDNGEEILSSKDFVKLTRAIETIFQAAVASNCGILVLTPYGFKDGVPQTDVITVYNYLIAKYGHKFGYIIISIDPRVEGSVSNLFHKKIIDNNEIEKKIEEKFASDETKKLIGEELRIKKQAANPSNNGSFN